MKSEPKYRTEIRILKNCAEQLRKAYEELDHDSTPVTVLSKIDGTAAVLTTLAEEFDAVLGRYRRTVGSLTDEVHRLKVENTALSSRSIDIL